MNMKKFIKFSFLAVVAAAILGTVSCAQKEADTDQLSGPVALAAMSPNPVVRGAELHLFGMNMDKVVEVIIPGVDPITEISKGEGKDRLSEIYVTVPFEGPTVGKVIVKDASGNTSTSKFDLTYTEGIEFTDFEAADGVLSGDVVTLKGEYMNSVQEVIFTSGQGSAYATGKMIFDRERHSVKVYVPAAATTGIIKVCDVDEFSNPTAVPNIFPSTKELVVGKPTVDAMEFKDEIKAGTVLTFTGSHLDMIAKVEFNGVGQDKFEINDDFTEIKAALPAKAADGDVVFTSYAGDTFVAATLKGVKPSGIQFSADEESEDPRFKAGYNTLITGEDLDLVTGVSFGGVYAGFIYDGEAVPPTITAVIPAEAPDGDVKVHLANGSEVVVAEALALVNPTVDAVSTDAINAREEFSFTGADLDLVSKVTVGGIECEFTMEVLEEKDDVDENGDPIKVPVYNNKKIIVTSDPTVVSGDVVIEKLNGWSASIGQMTVTYDELVSLELPASVAMGSPMTVTGTNLFAVDKVYIKGKQVVDWLSRTNTEMSFMLPEGIGPGVYRLVLDLNDGSTITWAIGFEVSAPYVENFIWQGDHDLADWGANLEIAPNKFREVDISEGDIVRIYYTSYDDGWWMFKVQDGNWNAIDLKIPDNPQDPQVVCIQTSPSGEAFFPIEVTAELLAQLLAPNEKAMAINGAGARITGVSVIHFGAAEKKTVIWEGSHEVDWGGGFGEDHKSMSALSWGGYDWASVTAGSTIVLTFTRTADEVQIRLGEGHWAALPGTEDPYKPEGSELRVELTAEMLATMVSEGGLVITGQGFTLTEVGLITVEAAGPVERTIWEGNTDLGTDWQTNIQILVDQIGDLPSGSTLNIYYTASGTDPQFKLVDINWALLPGFATVANEWGVVGQDPAGGVYKYALTDEDIDAILNHEASWGGKGFVISGQQAVITQVSVK